MASSKVSSLPAANADLTSSNVHSDPRHIVPGGLHNRVHAIALHIPWYSFRTLARIARDSGVSPTPVSRMLRGRSYPSLVLALRVTRSLSRRLGRKLDVWEVFSLDGTYPTPSVCALTGCPSCLPPHAYDEDQNLKPEFRQVNAGEWSLPQGPRQEALMQKGGL